MNENDILYLLTGLTVLLLAFLSRVIKRRLWLSEPLLALAIGAALGPAGFGVVNVQVYGPETATLETVARLTVAISIMGVALRLPARYLKTSWKPLVIVILVAMPVMWLVSSGLAWLLLGMSPLMALLAGAVVTPTDPVLADSIVTGDLAERSVDPGVRHLVSAEAGANDGLAFLLVMLPVLLMKHDAPTALGDWVVDVLLREVVVAAAIGLAAGYLTGWLINWGLERELVAAAPLFAASLALSVALLGGVRLLEADGLLAVFAAGIAMGWVMRGKHIERQAEVQEAITRFFDQPVFVLFGLALPIERWKELGWAGLGFVALLLLLRRLPILLLLKRWIRPLDEWRDALFVGWFGPIGAAAIVYATWARLDEGTESVWVAGSLAVAMSVLVHGLTATPLTRAYARRAGSGEAASGD